MSELDAANTAPPASDSERKTALGWTALVIVLGFVAVIVALWYFYQQGKKHDEQVTAIRSAPVVVPPLVKPKIFKNTTKKIAPQAVNTPPIVEFGSTAQKQTEPLSQFEIDVIAFETKVKKDFP